MTSKGQKSDILKKGQVPDAVPALSHLELKLLKDKISSLIERKPAKAAVILGHWLNLPPVKKTLKKSA